MIDESADPKHKSRGSLVRKACTIPSSLHQGFKEAEKKKSGKRRGDTQVQM